MNLSAFVLSPRILSSNLLVYVWQHCLKMNKTRATRVNEGHLDPPGDIKFCNIVFIIPYFLRKILIIAFLLLCYDFILLFFMFLLAVTIY